GGCREGLRGHPGQAFQGPWRRGKQRLSGAGALAAFLSQMRVLGWALLALLGATGVAGCASSPAPSSGGTPSSSPRRKPGPPEKNEKPSQGVQFLPAPDASAELAAQERKKIDDEVRRVLREKHSVLPPVAQVSAGGMGVPTVEVSNDTEAFLMVLMSGACSAK